MKTHLLTILSLFVIPVLFAQGLNTELGFNDDYNQLSNRIVTAGNYTYQVTMQNEGDIHSLHQYLRKIDTTGNVLWKVSVEGTNEAVSITGMAEADDAVFLCGSALPVCDVYDGFYTFVTRINSDGSVAWTDQWPTNNTGMQLSGLSVTENNELLVNRNDNGTTSQILKLTTNGWALSALDIPAPIFDIDTAGTSYFGTYDMQVSQFDVSGNMVNSAFFSAPATEILVYQDTLYVLTEDSIFSFNSSLQPIAREGVPTFGLSRLKVAANTVQLLSVNPPMLNLVTLDHNFQPVNTESFPLSSPSGNNYDYSDSHLSVAYPVGFSQYKTVRYLDFSRVSSVSAPVDTSDIAVVGFEPTSVSTTYFLPPNIYHIEIAGNALVKNVGANTVTSVRLNHYQAQSSFCFDDVYSGEFNGLNLLPGDSAWLTMGTIHVETNSFAGDSLVKNICVYSSHVNKLTDPHVENDQYCKSVYLGTVGLEELTKNQPKELIRVVDLLGREVPEMKNTPLIYVYSDGTTEKKFILE